MRSWKVKIRDQTAGHGMSIPSYELPYEGWEMKDPPNEVVDKKDFDELVQTLKYISTLESCFYCEECPVCGSGIKFARDAAEKALKNVGINI